MKCVILGAGKIARGFIGHLLYLSELPFTFIEKADGLVDLINERGQYTVNILGNSEKNCVVKGVKAIGFSDEEKVSKTIADADAIEAEATPLLKEACFRDGKQNRGLAVKAVKKQIAEKYAEQLEDAVQKKLFDALFDDIQYKLLRKSILDEGSNL